MINKVFLTDNNLTGHHKVYLDTLLKINNVKDISKLSKFHYNKLHPRYYLDRKNFLNRSIEEVTYEDLSEQKILHFLYLDNLYTFPLNKKLYNDNLKVIATLHHFPQNKLKFLLLKNFSKKINKIIVHSEYIKMQLFKNGIVNVEVVDYPSFYDYTKLPDKKIIREEYGISNKSIVISFLGGTRYDKGLDILLDSFNYVDARTKGNLLLNIVGKEESFSKDFIFTKVKQFNINARVQLGFVDDNEFAKNVLLSDYIILPYRKIFTGNSGPMTEAIVNNIPVIGPDYGNLGYLINTYKLGDTFEIENSLSLAKSLNNIPKNLNIDLGNYKNRLTMSNFIKQYNKIYTSIFL